MLKLFSIQIPMHNYRTCPSSEVSSLHSGYNSINSWVHYAVVAAVRNEAQLKPEFSRDKVAVTLFNEPYNIHSPID